jgi:ABC-2 type transport system permease protein
MKSYFALFQARVLTLFQYRVAALAGLGTQLFWGLIYSMVLAAFFYGSDANVPMSIEQAITFIWINQALLHLVPAGIDKELERQIKTGNVAYELVRPLDLYWHWYARALALRMVPTFMRCIPLFVIAGLFFDLQAPASIGSGIAFIISAILSALVSASITTIVVISLFWTLSGEGIVRLMPHVSMFLSGIVVPLPLFPDWIQPIINFQPFRTILDIPCSLYTGIIPASDALFYFALQLAWALFFIIWGKRLMNRATHKLVLQGG